MKPKKTSRFRQDTLPLWQTWQFYACFSYALLTYVKLCSFNPYFLVSRFVTFRIPFILLLVLLAVQLVVLCILMAKKRLDAIYLLVLMAFNVVFALLCNGKLS